MPKFDTSFSFGALAKPRKSPSKGKASAFRKGGSGKGGGKGKGGGGRGGGGHGGGS